MRVTVPRVASARPVEDAVRMDVRKSIEFDGESLLAAFDGELPDVQDMVALVLTTLPKYVADLQAAGRAGDTKAMGALAHTIKGSVGNVGATRLAGLTHDIEMTVRAGGTVSSEALRAVDRATDDLLNDMKSWVDALGTAPTR